MVVMVKTLQEYTIVTHTAEDLDLLAECMAAAIDHNFLNAPSNSRGVIGISITGSMDAGKSRFIDRFAEGVLPQSINEHFLSFHSDPNYDGRFSKLEGHSVLHARKPVVLSYMESDPETFWERFDQPGIHFDQNVPPAHCENAWLEICLRAPLPEKPEDRAEIFSKQENEGSSELKKLRTMFAYAEEKTLRRAGVLRAFKAAVNNNAEQPRMFTVRVLNDNLDQSSRFRVFTRLMEDIKQSPKDVSALIATAHKSLMDSLPSARHTVFEDDIEQQEGVGRDKMTLDEIRQEAYEYIDGLSDGELVYLDQEGLRRVEDLKRWKAYSEAKDAHKNREPDTPPIRPERADGRRSEKILQSIEPKVVHAGLLHFDMEHKKMYLLDARSRAAYAQQEDNPNISLYDVAKSEELSDEECLLIQALRRNEGEAVSTPLLLEEMYQNHKDLNLDVPRIVAYGLRRKITALGQRANLNAEDYIQTVRGKGFYLGDPIGESDDNTSTYDFE